MIPTTNTILALLDRAHAMHAKPEVIERLRWFAHFTEHGSISKTCTEFGIARTTFYRWYHRLDVHNLSSLENIPKSALLGVNRRIEQDKCSDCFFCTFKLWLRTYKERGMRKPAIYIALIAAFINISLFLFIMLPQVAGAASSWGPTLIVNTEAFQVIDDTDDSSNLFLQFGGTLNKRLTYDRVLTTFIFDDDLEVQGTVSGATLHAQDSITSSGSIAIERGASIDGQTFVVDAANNRVGIGTGSPESYEANNANDLVIKAAQSAGGGISIITDNDQVGRLSFGDHTTASYRGYVDYDHSDDSLALGTAGQDRVTIDASGNVGFKGAYLHGNNALYSPRVAFTNSDATTPVFTFNNDTDTGIGGAGATANTLSLITGGSSRLYINANGEIGIGSTSPDTELEVIGTMSGTALTVGSLKNCDTIVTDADGNLSCGTDTDTQFTGTGSLQNFFDNRYVETGGDTMTGALNIDIAGVGLNVTGTMSGEYINISGTGSRALFAAEDGQVSVNTSTPTDNYALTVKARNSAGNNQGALSLRNYNTDSEGMNFILGDDHNYIDTQNSLNFTSSNSQSYTFQGDVSPNGTHNLGTTSSGGQWDTAYVRNISPRPNEGTLTIYSHGTNGDIAFDNYTNEVMRIKGNESVGIGTTTPDTKLEVSGSGSFTGTNARLGVGTATADTELEVIGTMSGTHLRSGTGLIVESGRVGIGTDSPVRPLHMFGTDNAMLRLEQTESGSPHNYVEFYDTGGITSYIGHGNGSNDNFTIYNYAGDVDIYSAGGNNVLLNPGSGWVGIRNANPSTTLDVGGTMSGTNLTISSLQGCDTIDTDAQGNFQCGTDDGGDGFSGTGSLQNFFDNRYVEVGGDTMTGALSIYKDAGTSTGNTLVVDTKGLVYDATNKRVGVGTTSPSAALDVAGDIEISGAGNSISIDGNRHLLYSSNTFLGDIDNAGGNVYIREDGQNTIIIAGQDTTFGGAVTVNNDPVNIVQSVDSSSASLNVQADGGSALLYTFGSAYSESGGFEADGATLLTDSNLSAGLNLVSRHTSGDLGFFTGGGASGNQRMLIDSTGNIGIDTATPGSRLSVSGSTIIGNNIGSATADTELEVIGTMSGAHIRSGSGLIVEQGRVGIGTDSPTTKLHVSGDMAVGTVSNANGYDFVVNTGGNNGDGIMLTDGADLTVSGTQRAALLTNNSGNYGYLALYDSSGQNIVLRGDTESVFNERGNDNDFRIEGDTETNLFFADASTERIGIGTATPDTDLEVIGTASGEHLHFGRLLTGSGYVVFRNTTDSTTSFQINDADGGDPVLNVDTTNERVGIGTASPASNLHVISAIKQGLGALNVTATEYQSGAYLYASGASVLALDNYSGTTGSGTNAHIMFGYRNVFDTELYRHGAPGSGGIVIKTQQTSTSDNAFRVITQNGSANNTVFKVRADGAVTAEGSFTGGGADLAEWFPTADPGMTPGDITCLDPKRPKHVKRCNSRELKMIGIYSTNPGFIGNSQMGMEGPSALIGLIGQVPVKVIGNVDIGDSITLSKTDSVGKRAGPYDPSICIAMEEHRGGEIGTVTCLLTRNTGSSGSAPIDSKSVADYLLKSFKDSMRLDDF